MSDTPRTDDLARGNHVVPTEFAQGLERELNAAINKLGYWKIEADMLKMKLNEAQEEIETLQTRHAATMLHTQAVVDENTRLRAIFPRILESLQSGACSPDCSVEFLEEIPNEVRLCVSRQRHDLNEAIQEGMEQARLLGKSGEREADLLGENKRKDRQIQQLIQERDRWKAEAEKKIHLRQEIHDALRVLPTQDPEAALQTALQTIQRLQRDADRWAKRQDEITRLSDEVVRLRGILEMK